MDELIASHDDGPKIGSPRSFGLVMTGFFFVVALWPLWHHDGPRPWALVVALGFAVVAFTKPELLAPLNRLWFKLGLAIGRVTNPIIMSVLFFGVFAPLGIAFRAMGKDLLAVRFDRDANTYWSAHPATGGGHSDMRKQF